MSDTPGTNAERVLVLAPTAADAALTGTILKEARLECHACAGVQELERELERGAGVVLVTEDLLISPDVGHFVRTLGRQPAWSDVPILLLSSAGFDSPSVGIAMESLGNVTVLERPVRLSTLVSALRTAIRARLRQYELRDQIRSLRQSEERFQIVARTVHESIYDLDVASGRFWSSEIARPLLGHALQLESTFEEWTARRHPQDAARVGESFRRALAGDASTWSEEYRFLRDDGSYVTIFDRAHILRDARGQAVRVVGAMLDVTERKHAEATRALHAAIVESSDDAIVSKTLDGTIMSWNAGAERLFGWTAEEAIGRPIGILIPPGREAEEADIIGRLRQGRRIEHFETVRRRKDGSSVIISLTLSPVRDASGQVVGASKVARDITLKRTSEELLRKQSQRLRLLLEAASILLTSDDLDIMMRALFAQIADHLQLQGYAHWVIEEKRPARLLSSAGMPEEALVALDPVTTEDGPACAVVLARFGFTTSTRMPLSSGGSPRGVLVFASRRPVPFDADEEEFLRTICHYVTAAGERVRLIHRLRDTDRRKDEFLATLAHELRNPLAPVRSSLEIMRLAGNDPTLMTRARETMERQMGQMVRLIDDLLDVSRITRGRLELKLEPTRLDTAIRTAIETARPVIDGSGHRLILEGADTSLELMADPVRIAQVLSNLLNNAAKYTERGGTIRLSVVPEGRRVAITVRDSGVGIDAESLPGVFDLFSQVDRTLERSQGGLGIGLTLVKRLVEMHGGTVEAASEGPGRGAAFTVRLPVLESPQPKAPAPRAEPQAAARPSAGRRILIADDNEDAAESMALVLRMLGNDVRAVHDGSEAVRVAASFDPEVVLLDIGMPLMNGYDAARAMRAAEWGKDMLLVALTGWGQDDDRRRATDAGFDLHYTKPLEPADLRRIVEMRRPNGNALAEGGR